MTTPNGGDRSDRSPWNWLLILPIVLPLLTFLYNSDEPRLFGFPLFYWLQFSCIAVGVICHHDRLPDDQAEAMTR